jgi:tetratricopeptide (TPR) repeat protein
VLVLLAVGTLAWGAAGAEEAVEGCDYAYGSDRAPNDYRARDATSQNKWDVADVKRNHLDPAVNSMRAGNYSRGVMADIDFILRYWPNYYPALQALITYDLAGGLSYEFQSTACYISRARNFFPDDPKVMLADAYYAWKKGNKERAGKIYQQVLTVVPDSADAHYNLGLLYFEQGEFEKASQHARAAYAAGYPLDALRQKLQKKGYWQEQAAVAGDNAARQQ